MGSKPLTGLNLPSKESSPIAQILLILFFSIFPEAAKMPKAMGKSKSPPSFFISAGAKFTVIFLTGKSKPEFFIAATTLSLASLTAVSGSPTIEKTGNPDAISTSTSIRYASIP